MTVQEQRSLMTVEAAATRLALGRSKAWELITSGELRSVQIGRSRRVPSDAVDEYIDKLAGAQERERIPA
jgi:excisionase family DNA binding protein